MIKFEGTKRQQNIIALIISVVFLGPLAYWAVDREPPYTFLHVEIEPNNVVQGEDIQITFWAVQNRESCGPGLVYREYKELETGKIHTYDPVLRGKEPELVDGKFTRIGKISESIAPGPTLYRGYSCYNCNPLHTWLRWPVCVVAPEKQFTVIKKIIKE